MNRDRRYQYLVIGRDKYYSVNSNSKCNNIYKQDEFIQMLNILIDSIFLLFDGLVFQQTNCIPMGTNCAPLISEMFLHAIGAGILQGVLTNMNLEN